MLVRYYIAIKILNNNYLFSSGTLTMNFQCLLSLFMYLYKKFENEEKKKYASQITKLQLETKTRMENKCINT